MASKRKAKKMAKKNAAKQQHPAEGKETAMGKAMIEAKAKVEKKTSPPPEAKQPIKEKKPAKPPVARRKIIGYGSAKVGAIIHAITNRDNSILCDTRRKNYTIDLTYTPNKVNCVKCQKFASYKEELEKFQGDASPEQVEETEKVIAETEEVIAEAKEVLQEKVPEEPVKSEVEEVDLTQPDEFETLKNLMEIKFQRFRKNIRKEVKKMVEDLMGQRPEWFIIRESNGCFSVIHEKSRYNFVKNVSQEKAEELIIKYCQIPIKWDGITKPSPNFLAEVRKAQASVLGPVPIRKSEEQEKQVKPKKKKRAKIKIEVEEKKKDKPKKKRKPIKIRRRIA